MKLPRLSQSPPDLSNFKIDIFGFLDGKIQNRYLYIFGLENVTIQYHSPHTQNNLSMCELSLFNTTHFTHRTTYQCVSYHILEHWVLLRL